MSIASDWLICPEYCASANHRCSYSGCDLGGHIAYCSADFAFAIHTAIPLPFYITVICVCIYWLTRTDEFLYA